MLDEPQIVRIDAQPAAVIRLTIPRADIQKVMGPAIGEVMSAIAAQGIPPEGPVFTHHMRMDSATFDFEVGVAVGTTFSATGRVKPGQLPAGTVVRTVYRGPYEGLHAAWAEFEAWIAAEGHSAAPNLWERYVSGPESSADPTQWQTELNRPLLDKHGAGT